MRTFSVIAAAVLTGGLVATAAAAAPTAAGVCKASPVAGSALHGPVLHVPDGQTICVARGFDPSRWIPLRLGDAPMATSRATLMAVAFGKDVDCVVDRDLSAHCTVEGRSIGAAAAEPDAIAAGQAWREASPLAP